MQDPLNRSRRNALKVQAKETTRDPDTLRQTRVVSGPAI